MTKPTMQRRLPRLTHHVLVPALAALCLVAPLPKSAEASTHSQLEHQARLFEQFAAHVRAIRSLDFSDEVAVDRYFAELERKSGRAFAEGYVARLILEGAANRQLRQGVEAEISRLGAKTFVDKVINERGYAGRISGAQASIADMRRFADSQAMQLGQLSEDALRKVQQHAPEMTRTVSTAATVAGVAITVTGVVITVVVIVVAVALSVMVGGGAGSSEAAEAAEGASNAIEDAVNEAIDTVAQCEQAAAKNRKSCLDDANNQWAAAACQTTYLADIAKCSGS